MMLTEAIVDPAHQAILSLHRAILAMEAGDVHSAQNHCLTSLAWMRDNVNTDRAKPSSGEVQAEGFTGCRS